MAAPLYFNSKSSWRIRMRIYDVNPVTRVRIGPRDLTGDLIELTWRLLDPATLGRANAALGEIVAQASTADSSITVDGDPKDGYVIVDITPERRVASAMADLVSDATIVADVFATKDSGLREWCRPRLVATLSPGT
ncbi:hypothetical protein [Microvirga solisilvae]|uniref:hypothetical protein n=1 Tax=Microvirga solisilvae TaxID=2919498 RepID=UPI001FB01DBD|nr:hypothetical protein [Microvirga solisilvae]